MSGVVENAPGAFEDVEVWPSYLFRGLPLVRLVRDASDQLYLAVWLDWISRTRWLMLYVPVCALELAGMKSGAIPMRAPFVDRRVLMVESVGTVRNGTSWNDGPPLSFVWVDGAALPERHLPGAGEKLFEDHWPEAKQVWRA